MVCQFVNVPDIFELKEHQYDASYEHATQVLWLLFGEVGNIQCDFDCRKEGIDQACVHDRNCHKGRCEAGQVLKFADDRFDDFRHQKTIYRKKWDCYLVEKLKSIHERVGMRL